jgi:hypothetical protein
MRVATLFKRVLRLGRGRVVRIELIEQDGQEQVVVEVALGDRRVMRCSGCTMRVRTAYDTRQVTWRHLDLGRIRCLIRCQLRRPVHESLRGHLRVARQGRAEVHGGDLDAESTGTRWAG